MYIADPPLPEHNLTVG